METIKGVHGFDSIVFNDVFEGETIKQKYTNFSKWYLSSEINDLAMLIMYDNLDADYIFDNSEIDEEFNLVFRYNDKDYKLDVPSLKTFALIYNEYCNSNINYTKDEFLLKFSNILYTYYKEFENTNKMIDKLMNLGENDIAIDNSIIMNIANIPEKTYNTDSEQVDFISTQQKSINKKGKLQITKELLYNKKSYTTRSFLNKFKDLFVKILSSPFNLLYGTPMEEEENE